MSDDERFWELAEKRVSEVWASSHELSLFEEINDRLAKGELPADLAAAMSSEIGSIEDPDLPKFNAKQVAGLIEYLADQAKGKEAEGDVSDGATQEPSMIGGGQGGQPEDNAETQRFQTRAEAKERAIAEGFDPSNRKLRLFEIAERRAVNGDTIRWEIRSVDGGDLVDAGGPLFLDSPQHNDAALAEARGQAYAALRDACSGNYRDLRGAKKMADEKQRKLALLRDKTADLKLTAAHRKLLASVEEQIAELSDEFIATVAGIIKQEWDPGSSWEVVEAGGVPKIVRRETALPDDAPTKHAFREGQTLRIDAGVVPDEVVVRECLGESRYKVQSLSSHGVFIVDEADLYDPNVEATVFDGGEIGVGDLANLF